MENIASKSWIESLLHGYQYKNLRKYSKNEFERFYKLNKSRNLNEETRDSKNESRFLSELKRKDPSTLIHSQNFGIEYDFHGKDRMYYPDYFILTPNNYIAIVELKDVSKMNQCFNLEKYKALKKMCKKNGFLYLYCDYHLNDYEKLGSNKYVVSKYVETILDNCLKDKGKITINDISKVTDNQSTKYKHWFWLQVAVYIKKNKLKQYGKDYHDLSIH